MIRIAIVDDEKVIREQIKKLIEKKQTDCEINTYGTGEDLLKACRGYDILFLDIQMEGMNGIETAKACFGVFYLYDLFAMFVGDYSYKAVTYVEEDEGLKRTMQKIYYKPLEDKRKSFLLLLLAMGILFLAIFLIYQPVGNFILEGVLSEVIDTVIQQMGKEWSL